jgi:hypothetical protein
MGRRGEVCLAGYEWKRRRVELSGCRNGFGMTRRKGMNKEKKRSRAEMWGVRDSISFGKMESIMPNGNKVLKAKQTL